MSAAIAILIIGFILVLIAVGIGIYFAFFRKKSSGTSNGNNNGGVPSGKFLIISNGFYIVQDLSSLRDQNQARLSNDNRFTPCPDISFSFVNNKLITSGGAQEGRFLLGYTGSNVLEYIDTILNPNFQNFNTDFSFQNSKWCSLDGSLCMQITGSGSNARIRMVPASNATTTWTNVPPNPSLCPASN